MHFRLIPVLVLAAFLALAVRIGEFSTGVGSGGFAAAQTEVNQDVPPIPSGNIAEISDFDGETQEQQIAQLDTGAAGYPDMDDAESIDWRDATEAEYEFSTVRQDIYRELSERREGLDKRERMLSTREALLAAAERELDQKLRELTAVRDEISALLEQQSEEEEARMASLVRIYEGMKARDAANIFNTLDIDVLIGVMSRMSERRSAPILAEMNPERARTVTILLAQQKQLPSIPPQ